MVTRASWPGGWGDAGGCIAVRGCSHGACGCSLGSHLNGNTGRSHRLVTTPSKCAAPEAPVGCIHLQDDTWLEPHAADSTIDMVDAMIDVSTQQRHLWRNQSLICGIQACQQASKFAVGY